MFDPAQFILDHVHENGHLKRNYKDNKATIDAYLEDYAAVIKAFIALYEVTFDEVWLDHAKALTETTLSEFFDKDEELFYFTSNTAEALIARKKEIFDNVIPSSNAMMATNLYHLGMLLDIEEYTAKANVMLQRIDRVVTMAPQDLGHWASFYSQRTYPTAEIAIVSNEPIDDMHKINEQFIPNKVLVGKKSSDSSGLALLEGRLLIIRNQLSIYAITRPVSYLSTMPMTFLNS